ncbi:hypothetical protein C8J56DRAFT_369815 [Mycena floridula]|nr:hypothetical protein C8J56DRAFT_369815 [Mycena floridula]
MSARFSAISRRSHCRQSIMQWLETSCARKGTGQEKRRKVESCSIICILVGFLSITARNRHLRPRPSRLCQFIDESLVLCPWSQRNTRNWGTKKTSLVPCEIEPCAMGRSSWICVEEVERGSRGETCNLTIWDLWFCWSQSRRICPNEALVSSPRSISLPQ